LAELTLNTDAHR